MATFHQWLQDEEMQRLVATAPISLEADYQFQEECMHATDKMIKMIQLVGHDEVIGDVDIFFAADGDAEVNIMIAVPEMRRQGLASEALLLAMQYGTATLHVPTRGGRPPPHQGSHLTRRACKAVQRYNVKSFSAKISKDNGSSLQFFAKFGFRALQEGSGEPNAFGEYHYVMDAGDVPRGDLNIQSDFAISV